MPIEFHSYDGRVPGYSGWYNLPDGSVFFVGTDDHPTGFYASAESIGQGVNVAETDDQE